jgi:hypothetical protein
MTDRDGGTGAGTSDGRTDGSGSTGDWRPTDDADAAEDDPGDQEVDSPVQPDRLLHAGESLEAVVGAGEGWLAVTGQRLLAFDPAGDGRRFHDPHRLNVDGIAATTAGDPWLLRWTARAALYGVLLLVAGIAGQQFGLASVLDPGGTGPVGGIVAGLNALLSLLVTGLLAGGLLGVLAAVVLGGVYLYRRERTLTVDVAGERSFEVTVPDDMDGEDAAERLRGALSDDLTVEA